MGTNVASRLRAVWLALVVVTLISRWIGSSHGHQEFRSSAPITYAVLLIAAVKMRMIVRHFMEVRHAPDALRRLTDGWIALLVVALLAIYSFKLSMPAV
jgi:TRAP-type C4-dicarboxylate transport system permease large subunit